MCETKQEKKRERNTLFWCTITFYLRFVLYCFDDIHKLANTTSYSLLLVSSSCVSSIFIAIFGINLIQNEWNRWSCASRWRIGKNKNNNNIDFLIKLLLRLYICFRTLRTLVVESRCWQPSKIVYKVQWKFLFGVHAISIWSYNIRCLHRRKL